MRFVLLLALVLASAASAQETVDFQPSPGDWFPPMTEPAPPTTDEDRQAAERFDAFFLPLVEAGCPEEYPADTMTPFGEGVEAGDRIHVRLYERCVDLQVVIQTPEVAADLDALHAVYLGLEDDAPAPFLTDGLLAYHTAWLGFRQAACEYRAAQFMGGTGANTEWPLCMREHLQSYAEWVAVELSSAQDWAADEE